MKEVKRQFCSGGNMLYDWECYDMDCDLTKLPLRFQSSSTDQVFIEHGLEHFSVAQALAILDEFYRILKPRGLLRVCCPVLDRLDPVAARDIALNHGHLMIFSTHSLKDFIKIAGFVDIQETGRKDIDGHHRQIGVEKDNRETARIEARKP